MISTDTPIGLHFLRLLLAVLLAAGTTATAFSQLTTDAIAAELTKVTESLNRGTTNTAMIQGEELLWKLSSTPVPAQDASPQARLNLEYRWKVIAWLGHELFWLALENSATSTPLFSYADKASSAAETVYRYHLDPKDLQDGNIARMINEIGHLLADDGDTTKAIAWHQRAATYLNMAIRQKGENPELLMEKGHTLDSIVSLTWEDHERGKVLKMSREAMDLQMQGIVSDSDDAEWLREYAEQLSDQLWFLYNNDAIAPENVRGYAADMEKHMQPALRPVVYTLHMFLSDFELGFGEYLDSRDCALQALRVIKPAPEENYRKAMAYGQLFGLELRMGNIPAAREALKQLEIYSRNMGDPQESHALKCLWLLCLADLYWEDDLTTNARTVFRQVTEVPGFKMEDPDHFWYRCSALQSLAILDDHTTSAAKYLAAVENLINEAKAGGPEKYPDHPVNDVACMLAFAKADVFGHSWFDEPLHIEFDSSPDTELPEWDSRDLFYLYEKAYWELDAPVMEAAATELLRRGVSVQFLESYFSD